MPSLTLRADCQIQATGDKPARVSIVAYTGGIMRLPGWGATVIDLAGMALSSIPLLADHDNHLASVAGAGVPRIEAGTLRVEGTLASGTAAGNQILALHKSGVQLQASVGAEVEQTRSLKPGETVHANGRNHVAPAGGLTLTTKSKLREVSFVAAGADSMTTVSIAASRRRRFMGTAPQPDHDPHLTARLDDTVRMHYERERGLQKMRAGLYPVLLTASAGDEVRGVVGGVELQSATLKDELHWHEARCLAGEITMEELQSNIRNLQSRDARLQASGITPMPTPRASGRDGIANERVMTAAFCLLGGINKPEDHFDERVLDAADRASRGLGLQSFLMQAACERGYHARPGEYITAGNLRPVLTAAFHPMIQASGWSTADISNVLSNTAGKMLLDGFQEMPSEWRSIAAIKPVNNFKDHTFIRLLDSLEYEELGEAGEIKHGTLGDDTMTGRARTYARMLSITREAIVNDDLSALTDVPRRLGRAAAQKFNSLFWTAFVASDGFFAGGNGNVVGTGDERLSSAGLTTGLIAFRAQKSPAADGAKLIGGKPSILLVPPALEITARALVNSSGIVTGEDATMPNANPFQNIATLVVEDRLATSEGGNDAYWYLLRAPTFAPAMLVPALNGRVEPTVETAEADFAQLGIQMRGYSDVGVARGEKLCGLLLDGTSS